MVLVWKEAVGVKQGCVEFIVVPSIVCQRFVGVFVMPALLEMEYPMHVLGGRI